MLALEAVSRIFKILERKSEEKTELYEWIFDEKVKITFVSIRSNDLIEIYYCGADGNPHTLLTEPDGYLVKTILLGENNNAIEPAG